LRKSCIALCCLLFLTLKVSAQLWTNVQHVAVSFKIKNAGITVDGKFNDAAAIVSLDEKHVENSTFNGSIQVRSVSTENSMRDAHLRDKEEFFNVTKFPTMTMKALKVSSNQVAGSYKVEWLLTIKGISKKVTTDVVVNQAGNSIYLLTVFQLNRLDWKVGGNGILMSDKVNVTVSAKLMR